MELLGRVDVARSLAVFRKGPGDPAHLVDGRQIWRVTRMPTGVATLRVEQTAADEVDLMAWGPGADEVIDRFPTWFPVDDFDRLELPDAVVADARRRFPGLRTPRTGRLMEALVAAIIEQKVVGRDAFASWRQLLTRHGEPAPGPTPRPMHALAEPSTLAELPSWEWHRAGVDPRRYRVLQAACRVGDQLERLAATAEPQQVYAALRSIPGIGIWTTAGVGSRALGDADAASWGDYHLAHTVGMGLRGERVTDDEVPALLEPYRPYRGRVVRLLELSPLARHERRGPRMSRVDHRTI